MSLTKRDPSQTVLHEHDEKNNAKRVIIVGGEMPEFKMGDMKFSETQIQKIEVPVIVKEIEFRDVEKVVFLPQTQIVEVPVQTVVKEIEYREIPVPIFQTKIEYIDKPVYTTETVYKDLPKWVTYLVVAQVVVSTLTTLLVLFKK